ncbi:MAG: DUF1508 domain-containing protein [Myxococcales bacterium]|nr:DUF1508 domain-containing protein [Myxococcales bacterium]
MRPFARTLGLALVLATLVPAFGAGCAGDDSGADVSVSNSTSQAGRFELFEGHDGQFYFSLLAGNGEKVLRSEGYTTKAAAKKGIQSVVENGKKAERYDILEAENGEFYFNLEAGNYQVIGTSELYTTKSSAERGAKTVRSLVETVSVDELLSGDPKFEVFEGQNGDHYFRLRAKNGQIVLQSEGYASRGGAEAAVETVRELAGHVESYEVLAGQNEQHFFHIVAGNGEIVANGEMYSSKYAAERGAENVRRIVREMTETVATDADVEAAITVAAEGALYVSESDYGFTYVHAPLADATTPITEELVRELMASYVDADPDADKPLAGLYAMTGDWSEWRTTADSCAAEEDEWYQEICVEQAELDAALEENLSDIQVFYFGSYGGPGYVDGVAVSIIIVGRTPEGNLAGVRTIAIWT